MEERAEGKEGVAVGEGLEIAGPGVLDHRLRGREEEVDLAREEIADDLAGVLVEDVQQVDCGDGFEELGGEDGLASC